MNRQKENVSGNLFAAIAYLAWGAMPLYWALLGSVAPFVIVAFRVMFSMVFLSVILFFADQRNDIKTVFSEKKLLLKLLVSSVVIFINWALFIWGVSMGWHLDVSFGYFITPLLQVILGVVFLKEKPDTGSVIAFLLGLCAIIYLMVAQGVFPWFSIAISVFFALYGVLKKNIKTGAFAGLYLETLFMTPVSLVILLITAQSADIPFGKDLWTTVLLIAAGIVTSLPLVLYNLAAKRITLISLGFYQYLSPMGMFVLGVFLFHDDVKPYQYISFALIWAALIVYSFASVIKKKKLQMALKLEAKS